MNSHIPADCITTPPPTVLTPGLSVLMEGVDPATLAGRSACDSYGNISIITAEGVLGPVGSYLPQPVQPVRPVQPVQQQPPTPSAEPYGPLIGGAVFLGFLCLFAASAGLAWARSYRHTPDGTWTPANLLPPPPAPNAIRSVTVFPNETPNVKPNDEPNVKPNDSNVKPNVKPNDSNVKPNVKPNDSNVKPNVKPNDSNDGPNDWDWEDEEEEFSGYLDIEGMSLEEFRNGTCPESLEYSTTVITKGLDTTALKSALFDFTKQYGDANIPCAVWYLFKLRQLDGDSPRARRYRIATDWVTNVLKNKEHLPF